MDRPCAHRRPSRIHHRLTFDERPIASDAGHEETSEGAVMAEDVRSAPLAHEIVALWLQPPARSLHGDGPEHTFSPPEGVAARTTMLRNVSEPTLTVFAPEPGAANGWGGGGCPGGGAGGL